MSAAPIFVGTVRTPAARIQNADGTALVQLMAAGAVGSKIESISVTTDDTADKTVQLVVTTGGIDYIIGEATIPLGSGTNGAAKAVNLLNVIDLPWIRNDGVNNYMYLESGCALKMRAKVAVTAAKFMYAFIQGGDF